MMGDEEGPRKAHDGAGLDRQIRMGTTVDGVLL